jgi:hypothetical protein
MIGNKAHVPLPERCFRQRFSAMTNCRQNALLPSRNYGRENRIRWDFLSNVADHVIPA